MQELTQTQFREGDRVRLYIRNLPGTALEAGTIIRIYTLVSNLYEVRFDGSDGTCLMWGTSLKLAPADQA
jgi:hypothetical protein